MPAERSAERPVERTLEGKIVLITGSTRGIGWGTARFLAARGATVILNGASDPDRLAARVAELRAEFGGEVDGRLCDVGDAVAVKGCYEAIVSRFKRLDALVNNAGIMEDRLIGMLSPEHVEKTLAVNVKGVLYNLQYASRLMARQRSGSIVNVTSIMGVQGNAGQTVYAASKAAVIGATRSAAKELASQGIRVNAVAPGLIDTDLVQNVPPAILQERLKHIRLGRIGTADDVAKAVYFLVSDLSAYITGQVLGVDGGMTV